MYGFLNVGFLFIKTVPIEVKQLFVDRTKEGQINIVEDRILQFVKADHLSLKKHILDTTSAA